MAICFWQPSSRRALDRSSHDLAQPGGDRCRPAPATPEAQPSEPVIEAGMNRPAMTSATPSTKIVPSPASSPDRRQLALRAGGGFAGRVPARQRGHLVQPLRRSGCGGAAARPGCRPGRWRRATARSCRLLKAASICAASARAASSAAAAACRAWASRCRQACTARPAERSMRQHARRERRQHERAVPLVQAEPLVLGGQAAVKFGDFLLQAADLALQRGDPGQLLLHGLDAGRLPAQGLVDRQAPSASPRSSCRWRRSSSQLPLVLADAGVQGVQPPDGIRGHAALAVPRRPTRRPSPSAAASDRAGRWPTQPPAIHIRRGSFPLPGGRSRGRVAAGSPASRP